MSYKFTETIKQTPRWPVLIKQTRKAMKMTQAEFGSLFGVSYVAVSLWEAGKRDVPGEVCWFLYQRELRKVKK